MAIHSEQVEGDSDVSDSMRTVADSARGVIRHAGDTLAEMPKPISPAMHAVLDYSVAATFFSVGAFMFRRNRRASMLAMLNGAMVLGMSVCTDYPGGIWPRLSFKGHRAGDVGQALLAGLGPVLFGFPGSREATFFHGQALSELGVIAATDWDAW